MVGRPSVKPVSSLAEVIRFGVFEADTRTGELRKHGLRIKLQEQPFQVLSLLLARPGELVTRDELRLKLWPADTFVDFEPPPLRPALPSPPAPHEFAGLRSPAAIDTLVFLSLPPMRFHSSHTELPHRPAYLATRDNRPSDQPSRNAPGNRPSRKTGRLRLESGPGSHRPDICNESPSVYRRISSRDPRCWLKHPATIHLDV